MTRMLFYGLFKSTDGSNLLEQREEKCRRNKALSFFQLFLLRKLCVSALSSEACEPLRSTWRFMVHDIGQICTEPHVRQKEAIRPPIDSVSSLFLK